MIEVDRKTVDVATVGVAPSAKGSIISYFYWNPAIGNWQETAPTITVGQELGLLAGTLNSSGYTENMRLDMVFTDPVGTEQTLTGKEVSIAAGQQGSWAGRLQSSKVGTYKITLILYAEVVV